MEVLSLMINTHIICIFQPVCQMLDFLNGLTQFSVGICPFAVGFQNGNLPSKQCHPRSDCSRWDSLILIYTDPKCINIWVKHDKGHFMGYKILCCVCYGTILLQVDVIRITPINLNQDSCQTCSDMINLLQMMVSSKKICFPWIIFYPA